MSKYTIAMDMDGVLYPFDKAWNTICVSHGGPPHDFNDWVNFSEVFGDALVEAVWADPNLFRVEKPYEGAVEMMQKLEEMKPLVEVFILTNPGRTIDVTIPAKWAWIQEWFPWIDAYHFVTAHAKWYFKTDMIVEDFPGNLEKWVKHNPTGEPVLIERPWNIHNHRKMKNLGAQILGVDEVAMFVYNMAGSKEIKYEDQ